jgi:hypothetical protein
MVALQIRDVPEDVRDALAEQARARGKSLQGLLLELITVEARRARNVALLDQFDARDDGARLTADEVASSIDAARAERGTA